MTAAQNTIALKGSPAWGGLLAAAVVALIIAIIGIAISVRPVAAPARAVSTGAGSVVTITGAQQAEAYMTSLLDLHNRAVGPTQIHPGRPDSPKTDLTPRKFGGPHRAQ